MSIIWQSYATSWSLQWKLCGCKSTTKKKKGAVDSSICISIAALPSSNVIVNCVITYVHVRIYVGSGRRVGNFLNTAWSVQCYPRPGQVRGACVGCFTGWRTTRCDRRLLNTDLTWAGTEFNRENVPFWCVSCLTCLCAELSRSAAASEWWQLELGLKTVIERLSLWFLPSSDIHFHVWCVTFSVFFNDVKRNITVWHWPTPLYWLSDQAVSHIHTLTAAFRSYLAKRQPAAVWINLALLTSVWSFFCASVYGVCKNAHIDCKWQSFVSHVNCHFYSKA